MTTAIPLTDLDIAARAARAAECIAAGRPQTDEQLDMWVRMTSRGRAVLARGPRPATRKSTRKTRRSTTAHPWAHDEE
jgi:hypothetical protein